MKTIFGSRKDNYLIRLSIFLITAALIAGMAGCVGCGYNPPPSQNLEIQNWYDLDAVRDNLDGNYILMNDLDFATPGYEELASPTANGGKGWQPIGTFVSEYLLSFGGTFDGQGYEISDLFINRPDEGYIGLFGDVKRDGVIKDIGVVNFTVSGFDRVGGLAGGSGGTVSNSYTKGNVTGGAWGIGGLVGSNWGTVIDSYSASNVTGYVAVGGLVGDNFHSGGIWFSGSVSNSYSTGNVTGDHDVGGLVGYRFRSRVSNSFWDTETSGQAASDGGTGKTTAEMQDIATFSGAGWNIIAVAPNQTNNDYTWNIVDKQTYPFLSWQPV